MSMYKLIFSIIKRGIFYTCNLCCYGNPGIKFSRHVSFRTIRSYGLPLVYRFWQTKHRKSRTKYKFSAKPDYLDFSPFYLISFSSSLLVQLCGPPLILVTVDHHGYFFFSQRIEFWRILCFSPKLLFLWYWFCSFF